MGNRNGGIVIANLCGRKRNVLVGEDVLSVLMRNVVGVYSLYSGVSYCGDVVRAVAPLIMTMMEMREKVNMDSY